MSFTTHKKRRKFSHVVSFKLDDQRKKKLDECLWLLKVKGRRTSDTMRNFIDKLHKYLMESGNITVERNLLKKENSDLKKRLKKSENLKEHYKNETFKLTAELDREIETKGTKPQPTKTKPRPLPKPLSNMPIIKEQLKATPITQTKLSKYVPNFITCQENKRAYPPLELPCIKNVNYNCPDKNCEKSILRMIGFAKHIE